MYADMQEGYTSAPRTCTVVIGGDFNAQVGAQTHEDAHATIGCFGKGTRNAAGEQLVAWCNEEGFRIAETFCAQVNKTTWQTNPEGYMARD